MLNYNSSINKTAKIANLEMTEALRKKRLLVVPASNNVIRLLPPLNVNRREIEKAIFLIREVVSDFQE